MTHDPKYRRPLNDEQIEVLNLLYKFRFTTSDLLAQYFNKKNGMYVYKRLKILQDQGYIGKRFDSSYRIQGKPAAYYLLPAGLKKLNERRTAKSKNALGASWLYKDTRVGDVFVQHCLSIFGIYCTLKAEYGDCLRFFTKSQLGKYDYFSDFTPSVYILISKDGAEHDFFLEYLQSSKPFFAILQRLKGYAEYADSGEWEAGTGSTFPIVLLICDNKKLVSLLMKRAGFVLSDADDDLRFYFTTPAGLDVWRDLEDPDAEPLALDMIHRRA